MSAHSGFWVSDPNLESAESGSNAAHAAKRSGVYGDRGLDNRQVEPP